ncbi:MAG: hypothetical protein HRJ53_09425 [Acidobacteria bacterium Pan2503]|uniref:Uncharacterized protein n=1 Tax=Candidatus Acidiferrum panamense TaxID=2741543 RepID=A0A7V8NPN6_9BACT|nr:hypothetical protein [Candidatus Acidoferrum panamensis]
MPDAYYPKQPLADAVTRGLKRPRDDPMRQKVRMGDEPERRLREDTSISVALGSGYTPERLAKTRRGGTIGDVVGDDAAYRRPMSRKARREAKRSNR